MRSSRLAWALALLALAGSCSLTRTDVTACSSAADCREAFGITGVCGDDGYCVVMEEQPRCRPTFPGDFEDNPGDYPNIIMIGSIIDESNRVHRARARAVEVAIQDANDQGGLQAMTFGLIVCNNGERESVDSLDLDGASVAVARWLRDVAGVAFIVGPPFSGSTAAVFEEVVQEEDVLIISPSASSDRLTGLDATNPTDEEPGLLWRTAVPDGQQAPQIAADMVDRGITQLAIVHSAGAYGDSLAELVTAELEGLVNPTPFRFETEGELGSIVTAVAGMPFQEVLFVSSDAEQIISFINAAASRPGYAGKSFFLTDAAANAVFRDGVTDETIFARVRGTRPVQLDTDQFETFVANYEIRFGEEVAGLSFTSNAFDAAWIGLYGLAWASEQEPDLSPRSIAAGLRQLSTADAFEVSTTTSSSWATVQSEFASGNPVNVVGASGDLDFDPATEELSGNFEVWIIEGGEIVTAPPPITP